MRVNDLIFADDTVILPELLEILVLALEALHKETNPLGLKVSWSMIKVQVLEAWWMKLQSLHRCGEDIEMSESLTYFDITGNSCGPCQEVSQAIGLGHIIPSLSMHV